MKAYLPASVLATALLAAPGVMHVAAPALGNRLKLIATLEGGGGGFSSIAFSPDGKTLLAGGSGSATMWDVSSGKKIHQLVHSPLGRTVQGVAFSPDGKTVATCADDDTIKLWDATSGNHITTFQGAGAVFAVVFGSDGKTVTGLERGKMRVWNVESKEELRCVTPPRQPSSRNGVYLCEIAGTGTGYPDPPTAWQNPGPSAPPA
jgi:WD40 repeat protein